MIAYIALIFSLITHTMHVSAEKIVLASVAPDFTAAEVIVELDKNESIFQDNVVFATNNPHITVQSWSSSVAPQPQFDTTANMPRQAYTGTVTFHITLQPTSSVPQDSILFMHYLGAHHQSPQERQLALRPVRRSFPVPPKHSEGESEGGSTHETQDDTVATKKTTAAAPRRYTKDGMPTGSHVPSLLEQGYEYVHTVVLKIKALFTRFTKATSALFSSSSSRPLQVFVAFLLGILMSFTPCIYPMIPITVGLLGASASNSWTRNFLLAGCYTIGMATTFAILGLTTVLFGAQCGKLVCNPWFIALLIAFLAYCGGSMLGLYEFYTPRLLQPSATHNKGGNLFSAFAFGMISGTFASPCMSPGLALILSAAASLGNYLLAFLLLFAFGIGVSMPLLVIGTFSGAFNVLPRAGMWMNDIKKAFGFLLIMMCFYYAQSLIPVFAAWLGAAAFALVCGTLYAARIRQARTTVGILTVALICTTLITLGLFVGYRGLVLWHATSSPAPVVHNVWNTNYDDARSKAQAEHKFILADFTANWCPLCVLLDKEILQHPDIAPIFDAIVPVKIDGSSNRDVQFKELTERFKILGIPQLLLIDPTTEQVVHTWSSELLGTPAVQFRDELLTLLR